MFKQWILNLTAAKIMTIIISIKRSIAEAENVIINLPSSLVFEPKAMLIHTYDADGTQLNSTPEVWTMCEHKTMVWCNDLSAPSKSVIKSQLGHAAGGHVTSDVVVEWRHGDAAVARKQTLAWSWREDATHVPTSRLYSAAGQQPRDSARPTSSWHSYPPSPPYRMWRHQMWRHRYIRR